jgi:hypothetical protein
MRSRRRRGTPFGCAAAVAALLAVGIVAAPVTGAADRGPVGAGLPTVGPVKGALLAVSCPSPTNCVAVGASGADPLAERWNGTRWSVVADAVPSAWLNARLRSVSCPTTTSCFAVGEYQTDAFAKPLVEHWDGVRWSVVSVPAPSGADSAELNGVSCHDAKTCFAVGDFFATTQQLFVERWNGSGWTVGAVGPGGDTSPLLDAVSCPSATRCFAVGSYIPSLDARATLVERWNGSSWSVVAGPSPGGGARPVLGAVSCATADDCNAVGDVDLPAARKALAEHWNGTDWSIVPIPSPKGSVSATLSGASCSSTTACWAVGQYDTGHRIRSLVERWDGRSCAIGAAADPDGAKLTALYGLSCRGATSCLSVGEGVDGFDQPVAVVSERWDGARWSIGDPIASHATFECTIRSRANGRYVSADPAMLRSLRANAVRVGGSQRFRCIAIESDKWAIKSLGDGRYVTTEVGDAGVFERELRAVANAIGSAEKYTLVAVASCSCLAVKAANSKYVTSELGYSGAIHGLLRARSATIGPMQEFDVGAR